MSKKVLFVIDPQNDFMASPNFSGSLAVSGSYTDMGNLAHFLKTESIDTVTITMDTHSVNHIAHQNWWVDQEGNKPSPFTIISVADVESGKWKAANPEHEAWGKHYVKTLADKGKYPLCIWPFHCIKGTTGFNVEDTFADVVKEWESFNGTKATYITKGHNDLTEHYSGLSAEVPVPGDASTELNMVAIDALNKHDLIYVAGEALSHCVAYTTLDLLRNLPLEDRSKVILLEDCMSPVTGFENAGKEFLLEAVRLGARIMEANPQEVKNTYRAS